MSLNDEQQAAGSILNGKQNVFLTGAAGSGKSYLLKQWMKTQRSPVPVLASTGAAAILVEGRTFHSFFGLGIMEGGADATIMRALDNPALCKRMRSNNTIIIDEVSMISGPNLRVAETIAREARAQFNPSLASVPWGGMRVIVVGDFSQLPPVNPHVRHREWCFLDPVWKESNFTPICLKQVMRTSDLEFLSVLNKIRIGECDQHVMDFLNTRTKSNSDRNIIRLFSMKDNTERYNLERLAELQVNVTMSDTLYKGSEFNVQTFKKNSPIPNKLQLAVGAFVMFRQNDNQGRWVNGSVGTVEAINMNPLNAFLEEDEELCPYIEVRVERTGQLVKVEKEEFKLLDKDGEVACTALNFPLTLAWAMTIHKSQGMTVDRLIVDIRKLWEPGQAYVALSRITNSEGLFIEGWKPEAIFCDRQVTKFYQEIGAL